jgi:ABC-2 type transport system permease protein
MAGPQPAVAVHRPGVRTACRVELVALLAHPRSQLAALTCLLAPLAFVIAMGLVDTVPSDTLFGRWATESGMAAPLVVLGFAGQWGIPALVSVVAGDVFAGEDRHGTWPVLVTRSTTRGRVFAAKALAATGVGLLLVLLLGSCSVACGRLLGRQAPLVGLSGQQLDGVGLTSLAGLAWLTQLLPALAFAALAVMLSVLTRSTAAGTGGPVAVGLLTSLAGMTGLPEWLRELLPGTGFETWHGLFAQPVFTGPLLRTSAVSAGWSALFLAAAWWAFSRRDVRGS